MEGDGRVTSVASDVLQSFDDVFGNPLVDRWVHGDYFERLKVMDMYTDVILEAEQKRKDGTDTAWRVDFVRVCYALMLSTIAQKEKELRVSPAVRARAHARLTGLPHAGPRALRRARARRRLSTGASRTQR